MALLRKGLTVKTARNIIDSSFRAMYRDARAEFENLKGRDPFMDIQWPKSQREKPNPFLAVERDRIIKYWAENDFFYYPWVFTLFHTGMRPSEASALIWDDVDLERKIVSISKSRYMSANSAPKTQNPFCNSIIEPLPDGGWRRTKRRYCCDRCKTDGYVLRRAKAMIAEVGIVEFDAILERF